MSRSAALTERFEFFEATIINPIPEFDPAPRRDNYSGIASSTTKGPVMEPRKRLYETTFIVNASLEDTQIEGAITHIQEIITRNGGEITAVNRWGRKRLA